MRTEAADNGLPEACVAAYHLEQVASFGNACGTIAAVHALSNAAVSEMKGPITDFREETSNQTAAERGQALLTTRHLKQESDQAAQHACAQTNCPSRDGPALDHHYCAFVPVNTSEGVRVVELDGTKFSPVDHGPCNGDFLGAVAEAVKQHWLSVEPDRVDFS